MIGAKKRLAMVKSNNGARKNNFETSPLKDISLLKDDHPLASDKKIEIEEALLRKAIQINKSLRDVNVALLQKIQNTNSASSTKSTKQEDGLLQHELQELLHEKDVLHEEEGNWEKKGLALNDRLNKLTEILRRNMEYISELKTEIQSLKAQNSLLHKERESLRKNTHLEDIEKFQSESKRLAEKVRHLTLLLQQRDEELRELKTASDDAAQLSQKYDSLRQAMLSRIEELRSLKAETKQLETLRKGADDTNKYLEGTLASKNAEIRDLKAEISKLSHKHELLEKLNKDILSKTEPLSKENNDLKELMAKQQAEQEKKNEYYIQILSAKDAENDAAMRNFAKEFLKRELSLKIELDHLNKVIAAQNEALAKRKSREEEIILELNRKFRELFLSQIDIINKSREEPEKTAFTTANISNEPEPDGTKYWAKSDKLRSDKINSDEIKPLLPLIDFALRKGKKLPEIRRLLVNAGYLRKNIDSAIQECTHFKETKKIKEIS